jgi:hypothetical protein
VDAQGSREGNGGGVGSGVPPGGGRKRERGGGGGSAGLAARLWGQNGSRRRGQKRQRALMAEVGWRIGEGGGARVTRCGVTDMRGRVGLGAAGSGRGTWERRVGQRGDGALTGGPDRHNAGRLSLNIFQFQTTSKRFKLDRSKIAFPSKKLK